MEPIMTFDLSTGVRAVLVVSDKSMFLTREEGEHYILNFEEVNHVPTRDEVAQMFAIARDLGRDLALDQAKSRFRLYINGPGMASRPTFHIHIVCPADGVELLRFVDPRNVIRAEAKPTT
jgi:diadenosine tetraphosphate (Ap4A) HIT family hydrolase